MKRGTGDLKKRLLLLLFLLLLLLLLVVVVVLVAVVLCCVSWECESRLRRASSCVILFFCVWRGAPPSQHATHNTTLRTSHHYHAC
jgi:hypothetical protein